MHFLWSYMHCNDVTLAIMLCVCMQVIDFYCSSLHKLLLVSHFNQKSQCCRHTMMSWSLLCVNWYNTNCFRSSWRAVAEGGQNDTCNGGCRTRRQVVSSTWGWSMCQGRLKIRLSLSHYVTLWAFHWMNLRSITGLILLLWTVRNCNVVYVKLTTVSLWYS